MTFRKSALLSAFLVGSLASAFAVWAQGDRATVRIAWQPAFAARLYVARDLGLFEKAGLNPVFVKFVAGPPMLAALRAGDVDVAFMSANPALAGMAQGIDLKTILIESDELRVNGLIVRPDSGIAKLADLRGKKIGVTRGSASYYGLKKAIAAVGLPESALNIMDMPLPTWVPAFSKGDVDGLWVWSPWLYKIEEQGGKVVATLQDAGITAAQNLYLARGEWLQRNREAARRFVHGFDLATVALSKDRTAGVRAVGEALAISDAMVEKLFSNQVLPTLEQMTDPSYVNSLVSENGLRKGLMEQAQFMHREGFLKQLPDISKAADPGPVQAYLKSRR